MGLSGSVCVRRLAACMRCSHLARCSPAAHPLSQSLLPCCRRMKDRQTGAQDLVKEVGSSLLPPPAVVTTCCAAPLRSLLTPCRPHAPTSTTSSNSKAEIRALYAQCRAPQSPSVRRRLRSAPSCTAVMKLKALPAAGHALCIALYAQLDLLHLVRGALAAGIRRPTLAGARMTRWFSAMPLRKAALVR